MGNKTPIKLAEKDLQLLKKLELNVALEVRRICEKHDIKYAIAFGTLIGAVRHGGFIPWDDDIDFAMTREEYDRFLKYAKEELGNKYELVDYYTPHFGQTFAKVMLKDTVVIERFMAKHDPPCGVFVDIFPYDTVPENIFKRMKHSFLGFTLRQRILAKDDCYFRYTGLKGMLARLVKLTTFRSKERLVVAYERNRKRYNGTNTPYVVAMGLGWGYKKDSIPREWFDEYVPIEFEKGTFMTLKNYDKFLRHCYGDYMKLPPKDKRIGSHTIEKLDLTKYQSDGSASKGRVN